MVDISGVNMTDVLGISKPIEKLIETVAGAIGKIYEPIHITRMSKARAEEVKLLGEAIDCMKHLPVKYDAGDVVIDGMDCSELAKRAQCRVSLQELKRQNNIDHVVRYAAEELCDKDEIESQPVDPDWVARFFNSASDIGSDEMRQIWGKILAGEVNKPGSFSLRTLDVVRNMNQQDAELFTKIAPFLVFSRSGEKIISSSNELLAKYGVSYGDIMTLDECGLINSSGNLSINFKLIEGQPSLLYTSERAAVLHGLIDKITEVSFGVHNLTAAGKELLSIASFVPDNDYFIDFAKHIESRNKGKLRILVHRATEIVGDSINGMSEPLEIIGDGKM